MATTDRVLLCEGACNPGITIIDERISGQPDAARTFLAPEISEFYRAARYTAHHRIDAFDAVRDRAILASSAKKLKGVLYACAECGVVRKFGAPVFFD